MSLKCAVELGIADAIHSHGQPITLPQLLSKLSIPPTKSPYMRRLMRMLTHSGVFVQIGNEEEEEEPRYSLTPLSSILVKDNDANLSVFVTAMLHPVLMNSFQSLSAWFKDNEAATPLAIQYGCGIWDLTSRDPQFNKAFNEGMASDAKFFIDVVVKDCKHVFEGIDTLVDVGGGTGTTAIAISKAFPKIKCSVLDLPQVVNGVENINGPVDFIAGDMFEYIPPVDAVLLKWILHDWNDEDCVKILKRCKEAITSKKDGGKVIIIDQVTGSNNSYPKSTTSQLYFDMAVMAYYGATERTEQEWKKLFSEAGFSKYQITPALGLRSVIEVYP